MAHLAAAHDAPKTPETGVIETDALVIGAGPVGLFQVFELGLLEMRAHVVDALAQPGGQCLALYPDKPIYDVPGLPVVSGRDLVAQLMAQAAPFEPQWHLGQLLAQLAPAPDGRWQASTDHGTQFLARAVFIAAGVGAFVPRSVPLDGLARHLGRQARHQLDEPGQLAGQQVVILGDEDPALLQAIALAEPGPQQAAGVTLVHRRDSLRAEPDTLARFQALREAGALTFLAGQPLALVEAASDDQACASRLTALDVLASNGSTQRLPLDSLLILMGLSPRLGPVADWGLALVRRQLQVDTERFQTSASGIYAVGDINTYPGKRKLLLSGFHEATLAAFAAASQLRQGQPVPLQYTTTSTRLHQLLGVGGSGHRG